MSSDPNSLDQITAEASEWFIAQRTGTLSPIERERFTTWLESSPVHVREYLAVAETWGAMDAAAGTDATSPADLLAASAGAANVVAMGPPPRREKRRAVRFVRRFGLAAAVLLTLACALALILSLRTGPTQTYATARGEQRSIVLEDGSVIELNTLSTMVVHFDEQRRRVELKDGEAFFRVAHDSSRPFDVVTSLATVRAVGTQFNVYRRADKLKVDVVEGRVRVAAAANTSALGAAVATDNAATAGAILLSANEAAQVRGSGPLLRERRGGAAAATTWMQRRLTFDNQRLDDVVAEFNRYSARQMRLMGTDLAGLRITGVFEADEPETLVAYLEQVQNVQVSRQGTTTVLARRTPVAVAR